MNDTDSGKKKFGLRFSLKWLLLLISVLCSVIAAYRMGHQKGVTAGPAVYLKDLDLPGLVTVAEQSREIYVDKLLSPNSKFVDQYSALAGKEKSGVNRILERGAFQFSGMLPRGGGAFFSFTTNTNDYDKSPQIGLEQGSFNSGFYGGQYGQVRKLSGKTIESVNVADIPEELLDTTAEEFEKYARANRKRTPAAAVGDLYVVRTMEWNSYDIVAVFQIIDKDPKGATFVWRLLETLPKPTK